MFSGRKLLIATKHKKEEVIAPILEEELGVTCFVDLNFDTDQLGTFTGEIDRLEDPIATVRNKCLMAMELANCDLAVASEGSFGPHPSFFFAHADDEFLILIDKKNNLEIIIRELSLETNFNGAILTSLDELYEFTKNYNFPSHALIIRESASENKEIIKGITNWEVLLEAFDYYFKKNGNAYIETDMRAMYNPTRMNVIKNATKKLAKKILSCCPNCTTPGFGVSEVKPGLPCKMCNLPTKSTFSYIYKCDKCSFEKEEKYPHEKQMEDPMHCDFCNP